jgi:hypothetical protein
MAKYRNESLGVVNVGGQFAAPKKTLEVDEKAPGLTRLVKRGILAKVDGAPQASEGGDDEREALAAQYEERFGEKPHHAMKADTIRQKLDEAGDTKPAE